MKATETRDLLADLMSSREYSLVTEKRWDDARKEIEILEKLSENQIEMRAFAEFGDDFNCPACGKYTEDYDVTVLKFCPECGQRLKWNWRIWIYGEGREKLWKKYNVYGVLNKKL